MHKLIIILLSFNLVLETNPINFIESSKKIPEANDVFIVKKYSHGDNFKIIWEIDDGYYLYLDSIEITNGNEIFDYQVLDATQSIYEDEFFGKSSILRKRFEIKIETKNLLDLSNILIKYQGCSDAGICYPLQKVKLL